jgi:hypothetical protein
MWQRTANIATLICSVASCSMPIYAHTKHLALPPAVYHAGPSLIDKATKIADAGWNYRWVSDHEVILFGAGPNPTPPRPDGLYLYDVRSKSGKPLPQIFLKYFHPWGISDMRLSPDLRTILLLDPGGKRGYCVRVAHPDKRSSYDFTWAYELYDDVEWLSDSKHFRVFHSSFASKRRIPDIRLYDIQGRVVRRTVLAPPPMAGRFAYPRMLTPRYAVSDTFVTYWEIDSEVLNAGKLKILRWDLDSPQKPVRPVASTVFYPKGVQIQNKVYSVEGRRIAWRYIYGKYPNERDSLWVSEFDGGNMHEVGSLPFDHFPKEQTWIEKIQWLPGGKQISFIYRNWLYTVPAD